MAKPTAQQCHALTTYFLNKCEEKGVRPVVNRNKARWGFESILMDYSPENARKLIDYYVEKYNNLSLDWFLFNYDKVDTAKQDKASEDASLKRRREETQRRLEEWRSWQKSSQK